MYFSHNDLLHINGIEFSSGYTLNFGENNKNQINRRIEFLEELIKNKSVLHLGCTDHLPLIEKKILNNTWVHKRITESASTCIGIDINKEAISYCHSVGFTNIIYCDIFSDPLPNKLENQKFDFILIGELLEHVDNPVHFLKQISVFFKGKFSEIIITGPNALRWNNSRFNFGNKEVINSDHRFWFTPYTLAKLLARSGLTPQQYWFCMTGGFNKRNFIYSWLLKKYPAFQDTVVITAKT